MKVPGQVRGQPLVALLGVLAGWIGGRAAIWEAPVLTDDKAPAGVYSDMAAMPGPGFVADRAIGPQSLPETGFYERVSAFPGEDEAGFRYAGEAYARRGAREPQAARRAVPPVGSLPFAPMGGRALSGWYMDSPAWGHSGAMFIPAAGGTYGPGHSAWLGFSDSGASPRRPAAAPRSVAPVPLAEAAPGRWSADAWALFRHDLGTTRSRGVLPAVYGGSQAGAVLRYRLVTGSGHRPAAYLRGTAALGVARETAAAVGLSARPLPALPVVVAVEGRLVDEGHASVQPAALAYTELPPIALPLDLQAEAYLQAGYVGGRFATPFADGQVRLERRMLALGRGDLRLGGGLWAGAQKGAARLDAGPSLSLAMPLGRRTFSRISLDWRFRAAGNAAPGSGPAVTLSAGF
ncbi:hypothetical protein [Novosphingobium naphthalenivorans]|uniref:hypothetical protein n=1 Tax=Novosphingobium naphthalenivorans TaxID=273168 RepID=UPI000829C73F|nr:hypothetical protein [Novosphingobium naphthalenivorans]